jgi:glycosyltransferase involved in cell wall biosynthesis
MKGHPEVAVAVEAGPAGQVEVFVATHKDLMAAMQPPTRVAVQPKITVILPVYNEAGLIASTFQAVLEFARQHPGYHFRFVDDGSVDQTSAILRRLIQENGAEEVSLVSYPKNGGKGHAVRVGVEGAKDPLICFTDGDLAYSLDHLPLVVAALAMYDVVIGSRALINEGQRNIRFMRKLLGGGYNLLARLILNMKYRDTQAGLKGFRREAARQVFAKQRLTDFSFDVELVYIARRLKMHVAEIPAHVSEHHSYKVSKVQLFRDPLRMFGALFKIRYNGLVGRYD